MATTHPPYRIDPIGPTGPDQPDPVTRAGRPLDQLDQLERAAELAREVRSAAASYGPAQEMDALLRAGRHLLAAAWTFDPDLTHTLLVRDPDRGWVVPAGPAEAGEPPRAAAARTLAEQTGARVPSYGPPAAAIAEPGSLTLAYTFLVPRAAPLADEPGRPVRWFALADRWPSIYPHDYGRLLRQVRWLRRGVVPPEPGS